MDGMKTLTVVLTALAAPFVAHVMWVWIARPLGKRIADLIPDGYIKTVLTKRREGDY